MQNIYSNKYENLDISKIFNEIEDIVSLNLENRGMDRIKLKGELETCVRNLNSSDTVVIVTGFAIKELNVGETDGPPGALALAYVLENLNKKVIIVTDRYSKEFISDGVRLLNMDSEIYIFVEDKEEEQAEEIIKKYNPNHIIGIERPGRGIDNRCYSMLGEDITNCCPNTDLLFIKAKEKSIPTSAIGDGGNEVGMGKVRDFVIKYVNRGNVICAEFASDNLIVAGVSNWGAFAVCAGLCIINNDLFMYDENMYEKIAIQMLKKGAVDGCTKKIDITVDGLSYEQNLKVFMELRSLAQLRCNDTMGTVPVA